MKQSISIIITCRDDEQELIKTVATLGSHAQIIVVDDGSVSPIKPIKNAWIVRTDEPVGVGASRQNGVKFSSGDWLMFIDSHMEFPKGWHAQVQRHLDEVTTVWCSTYCSNVPVPPDSLYVMGGANFIMLARRYPIFTFADLIPLRPQREKSYSVPLVLGACYLIHRQWFKDIGGFEGLTGYGGDEQLISMKSHQAGGQVRVMGNVQVTHKSNVIYARPNYSLMKMMRNKLVVLRHILEPEQYQDFAFSLPISRNPDIIKLIIDVDTSFDAKWDAKRAISYNSMATMWKWPTFEQCMDVLSSSPSYQEKVKFI